MHPPLSTDLETPTVQQFHRSSSVSSIQTFPGAVAMLTYTPEQFYPQYSHLHPPPVHPAFRNPAYAHGIGPGYAHPPGPGLAHLHLHPPGAPYYPYSDPQYMNHPYLPSAPAADPSLSGHPSMHSSGGQPSEIMKVDPDTGAPLQSEAPLPLPSDPLTSTMTAVVAPVIVQLTKVPTGQAMDPEPVVDQDLSLMLSVAHVPIIVQSTTPVTVQPTTPTRCASGDEEFLTPSAAQVPIMQSTTPPIAVQPTTPTRRASGDDHTEPNVEAFFASPTVGWLSEKSRAALLAGFKELDMVAKQISLDLGLSVAQVLDWWDGLNNCGITNWNMYQAFFEAFQVQELSRLDEKDRPRLGTIPSKATVSAAYLCFKCHLKEKYPVVLRSWYSVRQLSDSANLSITQHSREFKKYIDNLETTIRNASAHLGFETIILAVGGIVNQDQNLAHIGGSEATQEFFSERYQTTNQAAISHLKAHV
ncbi:hypothetical protein CPB84DRAFT_1843832 [Gymnopilus junonius]|uniref:Uncharacterized protein n=1 Tax=Gymnopilus junonius TaxID=109634 RepID=A0A9P5NUV8_GYMJU|nr:hypothetical protein CPB84DRAFT_1843832 [Gymnopilus junonius]